MVGAEIATIAAAESDDPERAIAKATNSVVIRIAIFFVGSMFLLAVHHPVERATRRALRPTSGRSRRWASPTPTTS